MDCFAISYGEKKDEVSIYNEIIEFNKDHENKMILIVKIEMKNIVFTKEEIEDGASEETAIIPLKCPYGKTAIGFKCKEIGKDGNEKLVEELKTYWKEKGKELIEWHKIFNYIVRREPFNWAPTKPKDLAKVISRFKDFKTCNEDEKV